MKHQLNPSRSTPKLWGVIPAAGVGSRMQADYPKQYLKLGTKTVLEVSAEKLLSSLPLQGLAISIAADDPYWSTLPLAHQAKITRVMGGKERSDSVFHGIEHWLTQGAHREDWVLVHDAARPCIHSTCLTNLWDLARQTNTAAILASPCADTLKWTASGEFIDKTLDRSRIWQAQTPQLAPLGQLYDALVFARKNAIGVTDEASALEASGFDVRLVIGRRDNIKLTHPEDLPLAQFLLSQQTESF